MRNIEISEDKFHPAHLEGCIAAANKLIADACLAEYRKANIKPNGTKYKTYRPYHVPNWCKRLMAIIQTENEHDIKAAMHCVRIGAFEAF